MKRLFFSVIISLASLQLGLSQSDQDWETVYSFAGHANQNTDDFKIPQEKWRISWVTEKQNGQTFGGNFIVNLVDSRGVEDLIVNTLGADRGTTIIRNSGSFYLKVTSLFLNWRIDVQLQRVMLQHSAGTISVPHPLEKLLRMQKTEGTKVRVGMQMDAVRAILGSPSFIDQGRPESENVVVRELPSQTAQSNYLSSFYFLDAITVNLPRAPGIVARINGIEVTDEIFSVYKPAKEVFVYDGEVIAPAIGQSYKDLRDPKLRTEPKDDNSTHRQYEDATSTPFRFMPIVCVAFDRRTSRVASIRTFFKPIEP